MNVFRVWNRARYQTNQTASEQMYPWARSSTAGAIDGLNKWDLNSWNAAYWTKLRALVADAEARGIVVEVVLTSEMNDTTGWNNSPWASANNVNNIGMGVTWDDFTTGRNTALVNSVKALITKTLTELNEYDNVIYEICNEPRFSRQGATAAASQETVDWHNDLINHIVTTEASMANQHMIGVNYMNDYCLDRLNANVDYVNAHYTHMDDGVGIIELLGSYYTETRMFALDEPSVFGPHNVGGGGWTGNFDAADGRVEAWETLVGGAGMYDGLITSEVYTGSFTSANANTYRGYLKEAKEFMQGFYLQNMHRDNTSLVAGGSSGNRRVALSSGGNQQGGLQYALYIHNSSIETSGQQLHYNVVSGSYTAGVTLNIPAGSYLSKWINPSTGAIISQQSFTHAGGGRVFTPAAFSVDVALAITPSASPAYSLPLPREPRLGS